MPLILARLYEEDIKFTDSKKLKISPASYDKEQMSEADKMLENLGDNIDYRNEAKRESIKRISGKSYMGDDHDPFDMMLKEAN
jgi:hypothetical protein